MPNCFPCRTTFSRTKRFINLEILTEIKTYLKTILERSKESSRAQENYVILVLINFGEICYVVFTR